MKKSIFLFFAAILCAMTANAYNQSAVDLYFDNSEAKWSSCYVYIGHTSHTCCYPLTRVSGTQYLWTLAKAKFNNGSSWNGATGWVLCKEKWWDKADESIDKYTWHGDKNVTQKRTSAWSASYIYKTNGTASTTSDSHTITAYKTTTVSNKNYTVTINTVEGGTLTVKDYDNNAVATGASKIYLTVLKFSATPADGYVLDAVEINDGTNTTTIAVADLATTTHTLTSNVTINPVWRATTSTVTVTATATNGTVTGAGVVEAGTSVTLTATPDAGYQFVNWTVDGAEVSTANPYTFTAEADVEVVANFEELPKATIYFVNNGGWSKIQAYAWGDNGTNASWAGVDITANKLAEKIGEYDVYSYTVIQGSYKNVIFNDGSAQTADYVWTDGNYYWYDSNIKKEDNFAGGTKEQAETALGALVNYDYYLTGSLVGGWDPKQKGIEKDGELYKATFTDLAAGTYEFKITQGDWAQQWNYSNLDKAYEEVSEGKDGEGNPNGNIKIVTTAVKTITVNFDATANKISLEGLTPYVAPLTYTVTVPEGTEKCFIAGAMNGWNFQEMTATANANEFTIEIAGARETDGYKYACKADWDYVEKKEDGNDLDANRTWTANDVVAKWGVPPTYTIVGATAITGANWDLANEANKMIKDGEAYTLTKTGLKLETGDYEYKVAKNGAWGDGQYPAKGNQKVTITETAEYTIVYTYNVGTSLTAVATKTGEYTPVQTVYTVAGDAALCGTNWQADDATNDMTANGDGTYTWTKADVKLTSNVGFKVVKNHDFGNGEYPAENWNINLANYEGAAVYTVTITFTESSKEIAVTLTKTGEATPPVISYVLMGVAEDWTTGIALTRNEANTEFEEYMLLGQAISETDAVKVVKLVDGAQTLWCGDVKDGSAEHTADADGNIVLAEGTYDFYYDVPANKVYIGKQVPATATITLVDAGNLGATLTLSADEYEVGDEITASAQIFDDGYAFAYWKEGDVIVSYSADYTFTVEGDRTLEAYFGMNMPFEMNNLAVDGDAMTITGSNDMEGVATSLVLANYDSDMEMWSVDASASTISYGGNPLTVVYGEVWLDMDAFSMAMAKVVADFGGELCVFNLSMTAAGETLEVGVATELSLEFGALVMRGTWYADEEDEVGYPFTATIGGFDYTVAEAEYRVSVELGEWNDDDDSRWLGFGESVMSVAIEDGKVILVGTVTTNYPINTLNVVAQGNIQILPMDIDVTVEEMDMGDAVYLKLNGTDYESGIDIELYLNDYTGADKTYELNEASSIAGGAAQAMGSLTKAGNTYTGVAYASAMGALYVLELNLTEFVPEYDNIVITGLSGAAEARYMGWGNEYYLALSLEGTWSDGVVTYPVSIQLADYDPAVTSGTTYVSLTIGGMEDDQEWLGSIDGGEMNFSISGKTITLTGKLDNAYNWPAPIYWDLTITGTILPNYTRDVTLSEDGYRYGTICLPFGGTVEGAELYELVKAETDGVLLGSVNKLEAGVPYIFKATASQLAVYCDATVADEAGASNGLHGTFDNGTEVAVGNYILKDNAICEVAATCWVNANCAYIVMSEVPTEPVQQMPGRRYIGLDVHGENGTTGLDNIMTTDAPVKAIENGQLIIIRGGEKFNAQGQKL